MHPSVHRADRSYLNLSFNPGLHQLRVMYKGGMPPEYNNAHEAGINLTACQSLVYVNKEGTQREWVPESTVPPAGEYPLGWLVPVTVKSGALNQCGSPFSSLRISQTAHNEFYVPFSSSDCPGIMVGNYSVGIRKVSRFIADSASILRKHADSKQTKPLSVLLSNHKQSDGWKVKDGVGCTSYERAHRHNRMTGSPRPTNEADRVQLQLRVSDPETLGCF